MLNTPKLDQLRERLARAVVASAEEASDQQLRDGIDAAVDEMKAAGWPPERAIIAIKQATSESRLLESRAPVSLGNTPLEHRDALMEKVVRWTIERYYGVRRKG